MTGLTTIDRATLARVSAPLTRRQIEVLGMLADGHDRRSAAAALFMTESTLKNHLLRAKEKLGADTTVHAVAIAIRLGLLGDGAS